MSAFEQLLSRVETEPLSQSLPACLRIATAIGDDELAAWLRLELMGYFKGNPATTDTVVVPEYRAVIGQWYDDDNRYLALPDSDLLFVNELRLRRGGIGGLLDRDRGHWRCGTATAQT